MIYKNKFKNKKRMLTIGDLFPRAVVDQLCGKGKKHRKYKYRLIFKT